MANHLASEEKYSRSFLSNWNGALPSHDRLQEMMTHIIAYGDEELEEPTGGGTTTSEADPDWKQDSFIDNPVAEQVRECYRVYKIFKRQTSNTAACRQETKAGE